MGHDFNLCASRIDISITSQTDCNSLSNKSTCHNVNLYLQRTSRSKLSHRLPFVQDSMLKGFALQLVETGQDSNIYLSSTFEFLR